MAYEFTYKDEIGMSIGEKIKALSPAFSIHYQLVETKEYDFSGNTVLNESSFPVVILNLIGYEYQTGMQCKGAPIDGLGNMYDFYVIDINKNHIYSPNESENSLSIRECTYFVFQKIKEFLAILSLNKTTNIKVRQHIFNGNKGSYAYARITAPYPVE